MIDPRRLFSRSPANPILTAADLPFPVNSVFNPGAVQFDGDTLLLMRAERFTGQSFFVIGRSSDGVSDWRFDADHDLVPDLVAHPEDRFGIEDARIVEVPGQGFFVVFTSFSSAGPVVSLARTDDFHHFERRGVICKADDKDAAIFPRQFGGYWLLVHRPTQDFNEPSRYLAFDNLTRRLTRRPVRSPLVFANICLSRSTDMATWRGHARLIEARTGGWWDANKVGMGPPPLETPDGWLLLYHGVRVTASGCLYRSGLALLDLDDPFKVIARGNDFVLGPEAPYERAGDVPNVVFPSGWILDPDGRRLRVYYGAADSSVCMATADLPELLAYLREKPAAETVLARRPPVDAVAP